jgi:nucleotide-binding universal stress UspA family protein
MNKVLAAVDNSPTGKDVLASAHAFADLVGAAVEAIHVRTNGQRTIERLAEAAGIPLTCATGPVVERLVDAGEGADVVAVTIGARGTSASSKPLGGRAEAVATALSKPVLIVPPDGISARSFRRVLVPLEGSLSSSLAPRWLFDVAGDEEIDVVALHIHDERSIPAFTDQPQHEVSAWAREFVQRYCPSGVGAVRLETRVGRIGELVPTVAEECGCDLIALGWSRELSSGRAPVVHETIQRSQLPVLLVPVALSPDSESPLEHAVS